MEKSADYLWHGKEYSFEQKSTDWYLSLGVLTIAGVVACVLFGNILLALVIVAAAITMALYAAKHPRVHRFALTPEGLYIDNTYYDYERMLHFSILEYIDPTLPPALSIKTRNFLAPHLLIPITEHDPEEVYEYVLEHVPEGDHENSVIDRFIMMLKL